MSYKKPAMSPKQNETFYPNLEELMPVLNPDLEFELAMRSLQAENQEWDQVFEACNTFRRLALHHNSFMKSNIDALASGTNIIISLIDCLRS